MSGTTIGDISINLRLSMAKFQQDTSAGRAAVSQAANDVSATVGQSMDKSRESIRLLSEEIGIHLPRGLQTFVAGLPGVGTALNAAFSATAALALIGVIVTLAEKLSEFRKASDDLKNALAAIGPSGQEALQKIQEQILDLDHQFDVLTGDRAGALATALEKIDNEKFDALGTQLKQMSKEMDDLIAKAKAAAGPIRMVFQGEAIQAATKQVDDINSKLQQLQEAKSPNYGAELTAQLKEAQTSLATVQNSSQAVKDIWAGEVQELQNALQLLRAQGEVDTQATQNTRTSAIIENIQLLGQADEAYKRAQDAFAAPLTDPFALLDQSIQSDQKLIAEFGEKSRGVMSQADIDAKTYTLQMNAATKAVNGLLQAMAQTADKVPALGTALTAVPVLVGPGLDSMQQKLDEIAANPYGQTARQAAQEIRDATEDANEKYEEQIQLVTTLNAEGLLSDATMRKWIQDMNNGAAQVTPQWKALGRTLTTDVSSAFQSIIDGTTSAAAAFQKLTQQILFAIAKMEILKALNDSTFFENLAGGQLFGDQGLFNSIGGRAEGGPVSANVPYWVGERHTPELFVPKVPGHIVPMSQLAGGGSHSTTNIHMEIKTPDADSFGKSQSQIVSQAFRDAAIMQSRNRGR